MPAEKPSFAFLWRYGAPPVAVILSYFILMIFGLTDHCGIRTFLDWTPADGFEQGFAYQDARSLFTWLALAFGASLIALCTLGYAIAVLRRTLDPVRFGVVIGLAAAAFLAWAIYVFWPLESVLRVFVFTFTFEKIQAVYGAFAPQLIEPIRLITRVSTAIAFPCGMLGTAAAASLLAGNPDAGPARDLWKLDAKAVRDGWSAADGPQRSAIVDDLRFRTDAARNFLYLGSAILTIVVAFTLNWITWPAEFTQDKAFIESLERIGAGFTFAWGAGISMLIAAAYVPILLILKRYALFVAAAAEPEGDRKTRLAWLADNGIAFADPKGVKEVLVMLAPLLAGPVGAIFQQLPG